MKKLLLGMLLLTTLNLSAQQLQQHRWQNRLLLIVDNTDNTSKRIDQLSILQKHKEGLIERKLLVYQFSPKGYKKGWSEKDVWLKTNDITVNSLPKNTNFSVYLIGLDGGIKMQEHDIVDISTIFALIDGMPMRQAELRGE